MSGCRLFYIRLKPLYLPHSGEGPADVGDGNGASDDQGHVQGVNDFVAFPASFPAAHEVVGDAIVAAENHGSDKAKKFLSAGVERAWIVGLVVEGKEALDAEMPAAKDFLVQVGTKLLKIFQAIGHGFSQAISGRRGQRPWALL
jgi:hypothetical protein